MQCTIIKLFVAQSQKEGGGFTVNRPFPSNKISDLETDPFLLLDELGPIQ